ncbi:MAG: polysaccharide biosynthesis tyrosine autokinase [Planctomycetes bacterium]|nr:polysaccharide biosynthesis tyrosine autokinase [Planctomycetota bacterium]
MTQTLEKLDVDSLPADTGSRGDFLAVMVRRKWIVILFALLGAGGGQLYFKQAIPLFQSSAQISLGFRNSNLARYGEVHEQSMLPPTILSTELVTIQSRAVLERAAAKADLAKLSSINCNTAAEAAGVIQGGVKVTKGGPTMNTEDAAVLTVAYRSSDPLDTPKVVDAILQAYADLLAERSSQSSKDTIRLLTQAVQSTTEKIENAKREYQEWRKTAPLVYFDQHGKNPHVQRLVDLEAQLSKGTLRMADIRAETQMLEDALKEGNAAANAALVMVIERQGNRAPDKDGAKGNFVDQSLVQLMIQEQDLALTYGENHPKVRNLRKTIELIQQLQAGNDQQVITSPQHFLSVYLDSLRHESRVLDQKNREMQAAYEKEREAAKELLNYEHANADWIDKIDRLRKMFDTLNSRLEELNLNDDASGVTMKRLSDPAMGGQVEPSLPRSLAAGTVIGLLIGIGFGYLIDLADKSFRTPDEIRGQLRLPVIGHIPVIDSVAARRERHKKPGEVASKVDEIITCHHRPRSNVSEAYRSIRTAIYFGTRGEEHKVIQVTSADAGDGKTTLVCNLAVSFAQSGKRVCLIDADFRRSRIHVMFGLDNNVGISSVMAGQAELPDAIKSTEIENLWVLPCGPRPSNPSELLTSHRFKELLDVLRTKFDTILIDTPPLLAVTDPCAVAPRVDSVLLVIRITKHVRPNAVRAKEVLDGLGAKVVGIVVNGVEVHRAYGHDTGYRRYAISGYGYRDYEYGDYYEDEDREAKTVVPAKSATDASA